MTAYVSPPRTVLGAHKVTTEEISDDIRTHHPDHPRLSTLLRVVDNCGVRTRYFTRPLDSPTISGAADVHERTQAAFDDALELSENAAILALEAADLHADDIDAIVTTHATGWAVPNLDIHLVNRLGLRPTTRRIAMTTAACGGGAQALIRAADLVAVRPGSKVLVVASEVLSTSYNHSNATIESMIYKALFADSAAATVVTSSPLSPDSPLRTPSSTRSPRVRSGTADGSTPWGCTSSPPSRRPRPRPRPCPWSRTGSAHVPSTSR